MLGLKPSDFLDMSIIHQQKDNSQGPGMNCTVLQYIRGPNFQQGFQNQTFHDTPGIRFQGLTKSKYNDLHYYFLP